MMLQKDIAPMTKAQAIAQLKSICQQEANHFKVPTALIEIYLIRQLYARKRKRPIVSPYLKNGPLSKMLKDWNGPFKVLSHKSIPTFQFKDGSEVAMMTRKSLLKNKWDDFMQDAYLSLMPETKEQINERLKQRLDTIQITALL
jgi:hypothetical protein